jgi:hypothetical protein
MKVNKIKILDGGLKGLYIEFFKLEKKGSRVYNNGYKPTLRYPVHLSLESRIKELRVFMLELCRVLHGDEDKMTKDFHIAESEVTEVVIGKEGEITLSGEIISYGKRAYVTSPAIDGPDGYHNFDALKLVVKELLTEVDVYMEGTAKPSDEEVLIRWVERHNDKGIDIETIKGMSAEEQKETLTKLLEKAGACVMWNDEMQMDEEALSSGLDEISEKVNEEVVPWNKPVEEEEDVVDYHILKSEAAEKKEEELSTGAPEFELPKLGEELKLPVKEKVKK